MGDIGKRERAEGSLFFLLNKPTDAQTADGGLCWCADPCE